VTRRCFGLDVHRDFAQVAIWQDGLVRQAGQIAMTAEALRVFADSLAPTDEVALEATGNTNAIVRALRGRVVRIVVGNPQKTRAIAEAKVKTDKVDAAILAQLLAADYLPAVWVADEETQARRRQVARRAHIVRQRTRLKNQVQAVLHRNLIPRCPAADLFGRKGRAWLAEQALPAGERQAVGALLRQLDFHAQELRLIDLELARIALGCQDTKRLMTIPGVDVTVAMSITAAVGDFSRFASPNQWSAIWASTRGSSNPAASRQATAGSPSRAARTPAGCSSRPPGSRSRPPGRCAPSMSACAHGAGCRSPSWRPPAS
jgi:transposase